MRVGCLCAMFGSKEKSGDWNGECCQSQVVSGARLQGGT